MKEIEKLKELYFDKEAIIIPDVQLFRLKIGSTRYYYEWVKTPDGNMTPMFYVGCTSFLQKLLPESPFLAKWKESIGGLEAAKAVMENRALYGSMMHSEIVRLTIDKTYDIGKCYQVVETYCKANEIPVNEDWLFELQNDLLAFAQWMKDYNVHPLLIEGNLRSATYGIAGSLDLLCYLDIEEKGFFGETYKTGEKAGQPKESKRTVRSLAIVDYKSSKSGSFYLSHELQLRIYEMLLRMNFPQFTKEPIHLFNWSPKDWKTAPGYHFVDQTGKHSDEILWNFVQIYNHLHSDADRQMLTVYGGIIDLTKENPTEDTFERITLTEYVKRKNSEE